MFIRLIVILSSVITGISLFAIYSLGVHPYFIIFPLMAVAGIVLLFEIILENVWVTKYGTRQEFDWYLLFQTVDWSMIPKFGQKPNILIIATIIWASLIVSMATLIIFTWNFTEQGAQ